jgi:hypothetical protein
MSNLDLRNDTIFWDEMWIAWKKEMPYLPFAKFTFNLFKHMLITISEIPPEVWEKRKQRRERKSFFKISLNIIWHR